MLANQFPVWKICLSLDYDNTTFRCIHLPYRDNITLSSDQAAFFSTGLSTYCSFKWGEGLGPGPGVEGVGGC